MRVLLIKPPNRGFTHKIRRHFPVGLAYLGAVLRDAGHSVEIFDGLAHTEDNHVVETYLSPVERDKVRRHPRRRHLVHWGARWERIEDTLGRVAPDVVGVSCMFSCYHLSALEVARISKRLFPATPVVMGGSHATSMPGRVLAEPAVDIAIRGEAEDTAVAVFEAAHGKRPVHEIGGAAVRCGEGWCGCASVRAGVIHESASAPWRFDLDGLPYPWVDWAEWSRYDHTTTLLTSRGCPFSCSFCSVHATVGKKFRARDPRYVVDEMEWYIRHYGVRRFNIEDDNFTFDRRRVIAICDEIVRRGLRAELQLPNGITSVKLEGELIDSLIAAGFRDLFIGLESTDPAILAQISKSFTSFEKVAAAARAFRARGDIRPAGSLVVGLPGQDVDSVARDAARLAAREIRPTSNPFYPVPGSPDYGRALHAGLIEAETDPALLEGPACNPTFSIAGDDVYWIEVAIRVLGAGFPEIQHARRAMRAGRPYRGRDVVRLLAPRMVRDAVGWRSRVRRLEATALRPQIPRARSRRFRSEAAAPLEIAVPFDTCFCGGSSELTAAPSGCESLCMHIGDFVALTVALCTELRVGFEEVACAAPAQRGACRFESRGTLPPAALKVTAAFARALDEESRSDGELGVEEAPAGGARHLPIAR